MEQFKFIDERLQDLSQEFSEQIQAQPLKRLSQSLQGFANRAKAALVPLHEEQNLKRIKPTPPPDAAQAVEEVYPDTLQRRADWRTPLGPDRDRIKVR